MAWTDPITWAFKQVASAALFNQQIRDNMNYLKTKPLTVTDLGTTNQTGLAANTWIKVTNSEMGIDVDGVVNLLFSIRIVVNPLVADTSVYFDIYDADANVYLSSGTATPAANGLGANLIDNNASRASIIYNEAVWESVADGLHNYEVYIKASQVNAQILNAANKNEVWVREL